jgi:hypothetical protein
VEKLDEMNQQGLPCSKTKLHIAIDVGLAFSAMIRLFEEGAKKRLHNEIHGKLPEFFDAKTKSEFRKKHSELCEWGTKNISLAKADANPTIHPESPSYGQIAKTLDVVLKVVIYYFHLPSWLKAQKLSKWLNVAMDTKMMDYIRRKCLKGPEVQSWPRRVKDVDTKENTTTCRKLCAST